ncbi:MAG: BON domain-containing protein [Burkholderiales bacterium]
MHTSKKTASHSKPLRTLLAMALVSAGIAHAAPSESAKPESGAFARMDDNHDGYISSAEAQKHGMLDSAFVQADTNHDGKLDPDEYIKASSIDEREKVAHYVDDSVITTKVKAELLKNSLVKGLTVGVETYRGTVQLSGFIDNERQASKAVEIAASVKGVKKVINNLIVKG